MPALPLPERLTPYGTTTLGRTLRPCHPSVRGRLELFNVLEPEIEIGSPTWKAIQAFAQKRLSELRAENDRTSLDATQTAVIRGRIASLKDLLALPEKAAPEVRAGEGGFGY